MTIAVSRAVYISWRFLWGFEGGRGLYWYFFYNTYAYPTQGGHNALFQSLKGISFFECLRIPNPDIFLVILCAVQSNFLTRMELLLPGRTSEFSRPGATDLQLRITMNLVFSCIFSSHNIVVICFLWIINLQNRIIVRSRLWGLLLLDNVDSLWLPFFKRQN